MENPTFDETTIQTSPTRYKKPKPHIDMEKASTIPEFKELKEQIDKLQHIVDVNLGKIEDAACKVLTQRELYYLRHHLIQLRNQQYYLMDSYFPVVGMQKNRLEYYGAIADEQLQYKVLPRGVVAKPNDLFFAQPFLDQRSPAAAMEEPSAGETYFDFRQKDHLYYLIGYYQELKDLVRNTPDSPIWNLLWTLDFYIDRAKLSEQQRLIVEDKKKQMMNRDIKKHLEAELGISHQENYISTIWSKSIELIIRAVELNYDEWLCKDYRKAWKKCSRCGTWKLRDSRNFIRKSKSLDGLTNRCKDCDKELRQKK